MISAIFLCDEELAPLSIARESPNRIPRHGRRRSVPKIIVSAEESMLELEKSGVKRKRYHKRNASSPAANNFTTKNS